MRCTLSYVAKLGKGKTRFLLCGARWALAVRCCDGEALRRSGCGGAGAARGLALLRLLAVARSRQLREIVLLPLLCCWIGTGTVFAPLRTSLIQIGTNCFFSCIGGPPCWKRGGELGQIDDNRWSAIRQGGVPWARNSLTWGFVEVFFSLRPACRKTARFAPCDHRLSCVCPNPGAFSQQPPLREPPVASSQRQPPPPRIPSAVRAFACRGWLRAIARRVFRLGPLS